MDVQDFFGSIPFSGIQRIFYDLGYTKSLSYLLANLCCLNGSLPQGSPTSPALSNLYMREFDEFLLNFCRENGARFTRYADDITLSGAFDPGIARAAITKMLAQTGLKINDKKTRMFRRGGRQIVTGLIVNEKVSVPREKRRKFRQDVYYIRRFGLDAHLRYRNIQRTNYLQHLIGIGGFILHIMKNDEQLKSDLEFLKMLKATYL